MPNLKGIRQAVSEKKSFEEIANDNADNDNGNDNDNNNAAHRPSAGEPKNSVRKTIGLHSSSRKKSPLARDVSLYPCYPSLTDCAFLMWSFSRMKNTVVTADKYSSV